MLFKSFLTIQSAGAFRCLQKLSGTKSRVEHYQKNTAKLKAISLLKMPHATVARNKDTLPQYATAKQKYWEKNKNDKTFHISKHEDENTYNTNRKTKLHGTTTTIPQ